VGTGPFPFNSVFQNNGTADATLTATQATTALTFSTGRTITQGIYEGDANHGISITGELSMPSGATYTVASASGKVGTLKVAEASDKLILGAGALAADSTGVTGAPTETTKSSLVLTAAADTNGASLTGEGAVVAGGTEITGGATAAGWTAGGDGTEAGKVTITANGITGIPTAGSPSKLVAFVAGDENSEIKVTAAMLEVSSVVITLAGSSNKGKVTLVGGETRGRLLLKGGAATAKGSLVVDSTKTGALTLGTTTVLTNSTPANDAAVTGTDIVAAGDTADNIATGTPLGSISGGAAAGTNDATITGPAAGNDSVIVAGLNIKSTS
jgi:hypothetical protein